MFYFGRTHDDTLEYSTYEYQHTFDLVHEIISWYEGSYWNALRTSFGQSRVFSVPNARTIMINDNAKLFRRFRMEKSLFHQCGSLHTTGGLFPSSHHNDPLHLMKSMGK